MTSPTPDSAQPASPQPASPQPEELTASQTISDSSTPGFGWTQYAEVLNGRFAMVGFVALLITELIARQDFFSWLGL
ncbi:MAG: chlorophyll a/b-binding protein [Cyanobacteria bacterium J06623_4]